MGELSGSVSASPPGPIWIKEERKMTAARKIYDDVLQTGTEVTDEEFDTLSADELQKAIDDGQNELYRNYHGELWLYKPNVVTYYVQEGDWAGPRKKLFKIQGHDRELVAVEAVDKPTADELRSVILNLKFHDVYRDRSGTLTLFDTRAYYTYEDGEEIGPRSIRNLGGGESKYKTFWGSGSEVLSKAIPTSLGEGAGGKKSMPRGQPLTPDPDSGKDQRRQK
jgi:hypothetical protein